MTLHPSSMSARFWHSALLKLIPGMSEVFAIRCGEKDLVCSSLEMEAFPGGRSRHPRGEAG